MAKPRKPTTQRPILLVDTGTLLTLLLSEPDIKGHQDTGLLSLLSDMAKLGLARIVLTDIVLAEFLNSPVPISNTDLSRALASEQGVEKLVRAMSYRSGNVVKGFSKTRERIEWLRDISHTPNFSVLSTTCTREYLRELVDTPAIQEAFPDLHKKSKLFTDDPDIRSLKEWFWENSKEAQDALAGIKRLRLREHRGEISVADALKKLQDQGGDVHVLYQGADVRSRMIARVNEPEASIHHADIARRPAKKYNPHTSKPTEFDPRSLQALGEGSFLTTLGFLAPLMEQAAHFKCFVHHPDEYPTHVEDPRLSVTAAYQNIADCAARELGGRRGAYVAWKDVPFTNVVAGQEHESAYHQTGFDSPWRSAVGMFDPAKLKQLLVHNLERKVRHNHAMMEEGMQEMQTRQRHSGDISGALGNIAREVPDQLIRGPVAWKGMLVENVDIAAARARTGSK